MKKEEWIEERIKRLKEQTEKYPENTRIPDHLMQYIADMFESAWSRGSSEGSREAYDNVAKWQKEAFDLARK